MNLLNQLEEIIEQRKSICEKLMERGDVLTLLGNKSLRIHVENKEKI